MKAHPTLFEGRGGKGSQKSGTIIPVYNSHTHSKRSNKLRRLAGRLYNQTVRVSLLQTAKESEAMLYYSQKKHFTVKAHPTLFEGRGGDPKKVATIIPVLQFTYTFKTLKQTAKARKAFI